VDDDVDPFDSDEVEWAIATRVQPDRDIEIIRDVAGIILDPSLPRAEQSVHARTSKTIIDATKYDAKSYPALCVPRADVQDRVDQDWARYGLPGARNPTTHTQTESRQTQ
jgi:3-polyprenyl-4-hydroxybenzoate decarboxylase